MRILFLVYHGFSEVSGISKKIQAQIEGLQENGYEVHCCYYDYNSQGHLCRFVDGEVLRDYGSGLWAALAQRFDYAPVYDYCCRSGVEMVYARSFQNATPMLVRLFRRLKAKGIRCVTEIPTYPYDKEFESFPLKRRAELWVDRLWRRSLARQMEAIVTFSNATEIFGQRTIRISNGVSLKHIPLHHPTTTGSTLHIIGVAEVHIWHGYDRMIAGIGEYYRRGNVKRDIVFHIVGGVADSEMHTNAYAKGFAELIQDYDIAQRIVFHGQLFGDELNRVFDACSFAVGSLGRHRSGISEIKTLKNREYATRGLPFIYSECDSDFDQMPYVVKAPANDKPIDVDTIIGFLSNYTLSPREVRQTVSHLTWKVQMRNVVDSLSV